MHRGTFPKEIFFLRCCPSLTRIDRTIRCQPPWRRSASKSRRKWEQTRQDRLLERRRVRKRPAACPGISPCAREGLRTSKRSRGELGGARDKTCRAGFVGPAISDGARPRSLVGEDDRIPPAQRRASANGLAIPRKFHFLKPRLHVALPHLPLSGRR